MVCMGYKPRATGWKAQMNPLIYGGTKCQTLVRLLLCNNLSSIFFKKWAVYFLSFQTNNRIFTANQCVKMECPSIIQRWDLNPWPSEHESPPITTRPGLPPKKNIFLHVKHEWLPSKFSACAPFIGENAIFGTKSTYFFC